MQHNWSLRLARPEDAKQMPAIERAAASLFQDDPGLADLDPDYAWGTQQLTVSFAGGIAWSAMWAKEWRVF